MHKRLTIFAAAVLLLIIPITPTRAASVSQSFRISVVIPAIAGLNAPGPAVEAADPLPAAQKDRHLTDIRKATREGQPVLLKTIVLR